MLDPSHLLSLISLLYLMSHIGSSSANVVQRSTGTCALNECSTTDGCPIIKSNLLTTLPTLNKEFFVSVEFKATAWLGTDSSVLHLTENGNCCKVGERIPGLWGLSSGQLLLIFAVNGNGNSHVITQKKYPLNQWITVQFSQTLENGKYIYRVLIDGKSEIEVVNSQAKIFSNVKVYSSDPWYNAQQGSIRNLIVNADGSKKCGACTDGAVATDACKCGTADCGVGDTCTEAASTCTPPTVATCPPVPSCAPVPSCPTLPTCPPIPTIPPIPSCQPKPTCPVPPTCAPKPTCPDVPTCRPFPTCPSQPTCPPSPACPTVTTRPTTATKATPTIPAVPETCSDAGCKNAYNGLGICVDMSGSDWTNMTDRIDFSAGGLPGKCSKACNCQCLKHLGCHSKECEAKNGICLIEKEEDANDDDDDKKFFYIPSGYKKDFPCDPLLKCFCFTKPGKPVPSPSCKPSKKCARKKGRCYKKSQVPANAKQMGWCNRRANCKCAIVKE